VKERDPFGDRIYSLVFPSKRVCPDVVEITIAFAFDVKKDGFIPESFTVRYPPEDVLRYTM
jgi:hypothetical protein